MAVRVGTSFDDDFAASDASDIFLTFEGNDTIATGDGVDFVVSGAGNDTIVIGSGDNWVRGGLDYDVFDFEAGATGTTYIRDFRSGEDQIDLSALGVESLEDITVTGNSGGTTFLIGDLTIHINAAPDEIAEGDIIFAEPTLPPMLRLINFEDLDSEANVLGPINNGYAGMNWANFDFLEYDEWAFFADSGFRPSSGNNLAYNANGGPAAIWSDSVFDLESLYLSAGWSEGLEVRITGVRDGTVTGSETFVINYGATQAIFLDDAIFDTVDRVEFQASGGTDIPGDSASGSYFGVDDVLVFA